jgi:HSP20 family molecular chaperone IbpA
MSYYYTNYPVFDFLQSFVDEVDQSQTSRRAECEGGPCGARGRGGRHWQHHRRHWQHGGQRQEENSDVIKPQVDIYSTQTDYKVFIALPSADKESIALTYDPNTRDLTYSGTALRPAEFGDLDEEDLKKVLLKGERKYGKFEGKEKIPVNDDGERIRFEEATAKFENGVLELTLPKVEKEGPKPIVID